MNNETATDLMKLPFTLKKDTQLDVVGFGTNAVDHLVRVPFYPLFNSKVRLTSHATLPGGEVASTMVGLRRLGLRTAYVGRFGDDEAGRLGLSSLVQEGVDITHAETIAGASTQVAFIIIDEASGERTIMWQRDPRTAYLVDDAPLGAAAMGAALHLTPHDTQAAIAMARKARAAGVIVCIDIDNIFDGVDELLRCVDVIIASSDVLVQLTHINDDRAAMNEAVNRYRPSVLVSTLGAEGSLALCSGTYIRTPAFDVPGGCVDTTGAGDAFRTGFLYGVLNGCDVEYCCILANAVAALKCRGQGARETLPTREEVDLLVSRKPDQRH